MKMTEFEQLVQEPEFRRERYREMLPEFYRFATGPYLKNWADSFHLPPFHGDQTLAAALSAQERALVQDAGFRSGMHLLDIGCGVGGPTLSIAKASQARVTGLNIVPLQVELARTRAAAACLADQVDYVTGDMMDIPFDDQTFDGAFSFEAICHSPDKNHAYTEIARVLKPGAVFAGCDWLCIDGLSAEEYQEWIEPICASSALPSMLSLSQVSRGLQRAGFVLDECRSLDQLGDMTPNWDLFQAAADGIDRSKSREMEQLWLHTSSTARAGRSGRFIIGYWIARKPS